MEYFILQMFYPSLPLLTWNCVSLVLAEDFLTFTFPQSGCLEFGMSLIFIFPFYVRGNESGFIFTCEIPGGMGLGDRNRNTILSQRPLDVLASRELPTLSWD